MENLISTLVFIIPGFMLYFLIQMMGLNPVVKHSAVEFGALSALAWIPVTIASLGVMSVYRDIVWTLDGIKVLSNDLGFICEFLLISIVISFGMAYFYTKFVYERQRILINWVRSKLGKADLSKSSSVWEEVFLNDDLQIVGVCKIGETTPDFIGNIQKASRAFEAKRSIKLVYTDYCKEVVEKYSIPISEVFTDIDSGIHILIYDQEMYELADSQYREELEKADKEKSALLSMF